MIDALRRMLSWLGSSEIRECRRCGTSLDRAAAGCPTCGSEEIARYEL